eukprot:3693583-Prymnesium_polylepis.1
MHLPSPPPPKPPKGRLEDTAALAVREWPRNLSHYDPGLPHRVCPAPTGAAANPYNLAILAVAFQLSGPGGRLPTVRQ